MKKLFAAVLMSLVASVAFAMPAPSQIEAALAAHDYQAASSMTQEVLREKPNSAKAHLFNAYILLKQGNKVAANEELNNVRRLDTEPRDPGGVKGSALFGRTVAELEAATPAPAPRYQQPVANQQTVAKQPSYVDVQRQQEAAGDSHWILWLLLGGTCAGVIAYFLCQVPSAPATRVVEYQTREVVPVTDTVRHRRPSFEPPPSTVYIQPVQQVVQPTQSTGGAGLGMMGTVAGVAGGVVAGGLLMDAIHGNQHGRSSHSRREDEYQEPARSQPARYAEPTPQVNYETERSSFSSGGSDSWSGSSSSSSSGSDSWGGSDSSSSSSWD